MSHWCDHHPDLEKTAASFVPVVAAAVVAGVVEQHGSPLPEVSSRTPNPTAPASVAVPGTLPASILSSIPAVVNTQQRIIIGISAAEI